MATLQILKGKGRMTGNDGTDIVYPINKLRITTIDGQHEIDIKLDKTARHILPYMFDVVATDSYTEDENGNKCQVWLLQDKKK